MMLQDKQIPVVFRRDKYSGEIVAVFPTLIGSGSPDHYIGFTRNRGEISVDPEDLKETNSVGLDESLGVMQDAIKAGFYPLHVAQRISGAMIDARKTDPRVKPGLGRAVEKVKGSKSHLFRKKAA